MPPSDYKRCAFCDKSDATQVCTGCNGAPNPTITGHVKTLYCNTSCQKGHWNAHKQDCKAHQVRRVLYRASETAQKAFYMFRENTYDLKIERMVAKGDSLFLYEGLYPDDRIFFPFPDHLLPQGWDKQAALALFTCGDAIAYMHELFRTMLKGICTNILEFSILVRPPKRPVKRIRPDGPDVKNYSHEILRVMLKSGEQFVIDITGAQHGFHDPLYPWHQYSQTRIQKLGAARTFGWYSAEYCGTEWSAEPGYRGSMRRATKETAVVFDRAVREWEGKGVTVGEMLRMGEGAFERIRGEMMGYIGGVVQEFVGCHDGEQRWRMSEEEREAMVEEGRARLEKLEPCLERVPRE